MHEEEQGKKLVKVDRFFASGQICSVCGYKNAGLQTADIWYNKEDFVKEIIEQRNKNPERV